MRNPVERYWSQLRFTVRFRPDFSPPDEFDVKLESPQYVLRTDYARTLEALFSVFEPKDVLVLFYEDLFLGEEREGELKKITDFLGVDCAAGDLDEQIAVSHAMDLDPALRRRGVRRFEHVYEEVAKRMGRVPESWRADMDSPDHPS